MRRRVLNLLTVLSLLLSLAVAGLWVRSHLSFDTVSYSGPASQAGQRGGSASSHRGALQVEWYAWGIPMRDARGVLGFTRRRLDRANEPGFIANSDTTGALGLLYVRRTQPWNPRPGQHVDYRVWDLFVPFRFLLPVTLIIPLLRAASKWRRRWRRKTGHCPACGYDLRATSGRCPECGLLTPG